MKTNLNPKSNTRFLRVASAVLLLFGSVLMAKQSVAQIATFNFESLDTTSGGALDSLTMTSGTVTMTITRGSGAHFDIFDLSPYSGPPSWGARTLDPFQEGNFNPGRQFIADFANPICVFQIEFGDYDGDDDTFVLNAWSGPGGTGTLLDTYSSFYSINKTLPDDVGRGTVSGGTASIKSVTWDSTGDYYNSLYYDNIVVKTHSSDHIVPMRLDEGTRAPRQSTSWRISRAGGVVPKP